MPWAHRRAPRRVPRLAVCVLAAMAAAVAIVAWAAAPASAHVVPTSTVQLDVGAAAVTASVDIPLSDVEAATGIDLGDGTQADVDANAAAIATYLQDHFAPTSDDGEAWTVAERALDVATTGNPSTTGRYQELETTFVLTPPAGTDVTAEERSFNLGYDAIVEKVATHVVIVTVRSDTTSAGFSGAYEVGTIERNTVTDTVEPLHVDLSSGTTWSAFANLVTLGMQHIQEGTDHQLFLLTLLLPAPLVARRRRWAGAVPARGAVRRIGAITASFTLGHSVTLALGALGAPVAQGVVEAAIAVSILVAAVHAVRPIFPGREALVAATFGLVHGLAFSETLRALDLTGRRLVVALLGFNLGIEAMQLIVVALVLPPLILLARSPGYQTLRVVAATATGVAAVGWLGARLGFANPVAAVADGIGAWSVPAVLSLWTAAVLATMIAIPVARSDRSFTGTVQHAPNVRAQVEGAHHPAGEGAPV